MMRRCPVVLVVAAMAACTDGPVGPTPTGPAAVVIAPDSLVFGALGSAVTLTASVVDSNGAALDVPVAWSHHGFGVVSVSDSGVVTALADGVDTVYATAGSLTGHLVARVHQIGTNLAIATHPAVLTYLGQTFQLRAIVTDSNGNLLNADSVTWQSSHPEAIRVADGLVTAADIGTAMISATSGTRTASATLAVRITGPSGVGDAVLDHTVQCVAFRAGVFPCDGVDLVAYVPLGGVGASGTVHLNDMWGWTDPSDGIEYAIVGRYDGTAFLSLADPQHPRYLGYLPMTSGAHANYWRDIKVYQNHAYIVADGAGPHGMQVFDLTSLRNVTQPPAVFHAVTTYTGVASVHNLAIDTATGFAYLVGANGGGTTCGGGLHMVDIRSPEQPTFAGCFQDLTTGRSGTGYTHDAQCVIYSGPDVTYQGREICFGSNETALSIADVTDKTTPVAVSHMAYPSVAYAHQGWLSEDQRYFFTNDELDEYDGYVATTRTLIWDVSDLTDPVLAHQYYGPTDATDHNNYVVGDVLYASNYQFGIRLIGIATPTAPVQLGFFDTAPEQDNVPGFGGSWSNYPFFASGIIAVTSSEEGLFILRRH